MKKLLLFFMLLFSLLGFSQFEGFEGAFPPTGWAVFDNGIGTAQTWQAAPPGQQYTGNGAAYLNRENVLDGSLAADWLVTNQVTIPTDGQVRFYTKLTQAGIQGSTFSVRMNNTTANQTTEADFFVVPGASWNESTLMNGTTAAEQITYIQKVVDLSVYAGETVFLAFVMENDNGDRWFIDNVNVTSKCLDITTQTVSNVSDVSVSLGWDNPSGASQWDIQYGPPGFAIDDANSISINGVTTNPYDLTSLTPATTYEFYVRANCGNDNFSEWFGPFAFTTGICAVSDQCEFTFSMTDSYGDGWNGATMQVNQLGVTLATIGPTFTTGSGPIDVVVSLCSNQPFELFWSNGGSYPAEVGISIIDPLNVTIFNMPNQNEALAGTVLYNAPAACTPPTCPQPSNILFSSLGTTSGTVSWSDNTSGNASQWEVIIQPVGTGYPPLGTTPTATVSTTSYNFSGLSSATEYEVYVRAICGGPDPSFWNGPENFSTVPDYCAGDHFYDSGGVGDIYSANENITTTICPDNSGNVVVAFFNSFNLDTSDFLTVYNGSSTASPVLGTFTGNTLPPILVSTALDGCLTFNFTSDGFTNLAGWDATIQCISPPTCPNPNGLVVSSISDTGATFEWNEAGTATSWEVIIQPAGTGYPTGAGTIVTTNPYIATGLNPDTSYEFYVRAICGPGDSSFWSGPLPFSTLFAGCGGSDPAGNACPEAPPVCNLDGYCGNTSGSYSVNTWPELTTAFCGSIENNSFLSFQATSTTISFDVNVGNCTNGSGIQFFIFSAATCGSGPVNSINCYSPMDPGVNALSFTGLTIGQTYFLMIDGYAGAICDYSVTVTSGGSTSTDVEITQSNTTICIDETLSIDVSGGNGIYNWSPGSGLDTTTGNTVTFTPSAPGTYIIQVESTDTNALCATADFIEITVLEKTIPSFTVPGPFCLGDPSVTLSDTSNNGVQGVWTPSATIDTSISGITQYTFTPDASFQCAEVVVIDVEVTASCTFNSYATAVFIESCETTPGGDFYNVTGSGATSIGPLTNVFPNNDFGTFVQNSGNLVLRGAQLKSFKTSASNVCGATLYYRVYESGAATLPGFTPMSLSLYDDCVVNTFPTGGTCNPGDQKWQDLTANIPLATNNPGDYIVEVYFELIGDNDDPSQCDDTIFVNNGGNNFKATFSIQSTPTFTSQNEECGSSNAFITVSGFNPGDVYSVTYDDDTVTVGPTDYTANSTGEIIISGLNAGTYDNFNFEINGCVITEITPIVITNFSPSVTQITNNSDICFGSDAVFTVTGTPNYSLGYSINGGSPLTIVFDSSGIAIITVVNPAVGNVNLSLLSISNSACNIVLTDTDTVIVNPLPQVTSFDPVNSIVCLGSDSEFVINGTPNATVTYSVDGGASQTVTLDGSGTYTILIPTSNTPNQAQNIEINLIDIINSSTLCSNNLSGVTANVTVVSVPIATIDADPQPISPIDPANPIARFCVDEGEGVTIDIASPLVNQLNYPSDIFISEVTDSQSGSLTYIEIYNGTGATVDLSNYKIRLYNGGGYPTFPPTSEYVLSGMLNNDDVVVIKIGSSANIVGVVPDLSFAGFNINNNDNIRLTNLSNVDIDVWGYSDGSTLPYGIGYDYRRNESGTILPSTVWDPADWTATDWNLTTFDYSDVGSYTLFLADYDFQLSILDVNSLPNEVYLPVETISLPNVTFTNPLEAGNYTLVTYDKVVQCYSLPLKIVVKEKAAFNLGEMEVCMGAAVDLPEVEVPVTDEYGQVVLDGSGNPVMIEVDGTWSPSQVSTSSVGTLVYTFIPNTNNGSCYGTGEFSVTTISCAIQKGISPNNDGKNDSFDLSGFNVNKLEIFNRYGREVYTKSNYEDEWFGQTNNGDELPDGTYYYVIEFADMDSKTGWIYINRQQ
ncbi:T9SS type B sorting domain-containing protein, partial [Flavobacterium jejuense]